MPRIIVSFVASILSLLASILALLVLIPDDVPADEVMPHSRAIELRRPSGALEIPPRSGVVEVPPPTVRAPEGVGDRGAGHRGMAGRGAAEGWPADLGPSDRDDLEPGTDRASGNRGLGPNVDVTTNGSPQVETTIAADPLDPANLLAGAADYRFGDSDGGYAYSFDAGATWYAGTLAAANPALARYDAQGDPAVAPYRDGVFYYAFIDFNRLDDENRLGIAKTTDGGVTWPTLGVVIDHSGPGSHDFEDKEYIAVDNTGGPHDGNVYVSWTRFPAAAPNRVMFSRSTDGGATYSTPLQISDGTTYYQGSVPAVAPNGDVYVAWIFGFQIQIDRSTDGGATWGSDRLVSTVSPIPSPLPGASFRVNSFPTIAVDRSGGPHHGDVYVAWADDQGVGAGPDILFSRSTDSGATWSAPIRVSDDTNGSYQWFPWMSVGPDGGIDIVFFDRRETPGSTRYHTYMATSTDGGASFDPNVRVSDAVSNAVNDGFGGTFIGDYNGICSTAGGAHPYWTDVRDSNANAEGYTAAVSFDPVPDITANGSDGPLSINAGDPLRIDVALDAGNRAGDDADWWLVADTPLGWYHYDVGSGLWQSGLLPGFQGGLLSFGPYEAFNGSAPPAGSYVFYFAVDMVPNGSPDLDQAFIDDVRVDIQ